MPSNENFIANILKTRQSNREFIDFLKKLNFSPRTIIDVGVATGTPEIYGLNNEAFLALIEPIVEFNAMLEPILRRRNAHLYSCAAGAFDGQVEIWVTPDMTTSSLLVPMNATEDALRRNVTCCRLDTLYNKHEWLAPFLLKIDTQGAELLVLEGAQEVLNHTEVVMLEVSLFPFSPGLPEFYEVVCYMKTCGFVVYDLFNGHNRPLDNARGQVDVVFVKENGIFREDSRWGTEEQCQEFLQCKFRNEVYQKLNPHFSPD
ncbi:FkbM family methyltransferase [Chrysiogenes arsenatis]|uniref:FkbM family methyltransferase n=1 Tax=Chrysiogenes arsenatis TaxID=309797 RepID=UPI000420520B|nr:FkbM family methyltransferase [Chrysiogenes arsenatis]